VAGLVGRRSAPAVGKVRGRLCSSNGC
jgi:hypothetical protein